MSGTDALLWVYVALAFVAALALLASHWPRWAKALLVVGVSALYFLAETAFDDVWGWPSRHALPERFVLLAAVIEEPTRTRPGALYVWVNALEGGKPAPRPRAYQLPYSKDLHALLDEGMKKARQGIAQMGTAEPRRGPRGLSWLRPGSDEQNVKIRDLPLPQLPEK
ncbi:MAG: hypothetical protein IPM99_18235 [Rubrivivax sp.]|nr:hypothetical protein [Rubrivivax sp.]